MDEQAIREAMVEALGKRHPWSRATPGERSNAREWTGRQEWAHVIRRAREGGRPSGPHLRRLARSYGIPPEAVDLVAERIDGGPGARPFEEPQDGGVFGGVSVGQLIAVADWLSLWEELRAYRTTEPGPRGARTWGRVIPVAGPDGSPVAVMLRRPASGGPWTVSVPKETARGIVAEAHGLKSEESLRDWERTVRGSPAARLLAQRKPSPPPTPGD